MGLRNAIAALDRAAMRRVAQNDSRLLDLVMPRLSRAANHGMLWTGLAIGRWRTGASGGRGAAVGVEGLGGGERAGGRGPASRQLQRAPRTTSFPSGHAASAAAFATGVALEQPALAAPVIVLAAAVGASRVVTGVHYPSDVLAGFAIGAAAGAATVHWWPRRPPVPAAAVRPPRDAPEAPAGEGLVLAVNASAGTASSGLARRLRAELPRAVIIETHAGQDLAGQLRLSTGRARVLGVAGGDGTVSAACGGGLEAGLPLLLVPPGTFHHFAADLGVWSVEDALAALRAGEAVLVDVGVADRRSFINTSSTGVYVDLVRAREELENTLGRRVAGSLPLGPGLPRRQPHELILNRPRRPLP